jgi:serine/threonine protein kinase
MIFGGQVAAVKIVKFQELGVDFNAMLKEIETLMSLRHQNVVGYKGYFRDSPRCLAGLAMEYASGGTLQDMCLTGSNIVKRIVVVTNWLLDVSAGMEYVHGRGVVHRDLKCPNVLLSWSKSKQRLEAKLADFGLAVVQSSTAASQLRSRVGTHTHFSPERAHGEGYGKGADMWAVGCILLEIVLGQPLTEPLWSEREVVKKRRETMLASVKSESELLWRQAVGLLEQDVEARMSAQDLKLNLSQVLCLMLHLEKNIVLVQDAGSWSRKCTKNCILNLGL